MNARWLRWTAVGICALLLLCGCALAQTYDLEEALALVGSEESHGGDGRLELSGGFEEVNVFSSMFFQSDGGKSAIIWIDGPEKEFEVSSERFSDDYEGKDIGSRHVYLCAELMEQIPEEQRAKTPEEIENLLVIETRRILSGIITSTEGGSDDDLPNSWDIQRMIADGEDGDAVLPLNPSFRIAVSYKPVFSCLMCSYVYNVANGSSSFVRYEVNDHSELRRNPEASDIWDNMLELTELMGDAEAWIQADAQDALMNGNYEYFLSEEDYQTLSQSIDDGDVHAVNAQCDALYWGMAQELKDADVIAANLYDEAIDARSYPVMAYIANSRSYSAVDKSDWIIESEKLYLGAPDAQLLDSITQDSMDILNLAQWDMELMSILLSA